MTERLVVSCPVCQVRWDMDLDPPQCEDPDHPHALSYDEPCAVPAEPMADLPLKDFTAFDAYGVPGTLAYCDCGAGPRHLVSQVPETKEVMVHFHADAVTRAITILEITGGE